MKRISGDSWLAIALLLVLAIVTIAAAVSQSQDQQLPPLTSLSNAPDGARALRLWLEEIGFTTSSEVEATFHPPEEASLMFMLEPQPGIQNNEWERIDEWVEAGGTLILAGDQWGILRAVQHYDFQLYYLPNSVPELTLQTPLPESPAITGNINVQTSGYFISSRHDYVTHLAAGSRPVILSFSRGEGRVILSATPFPFSNAGLKEAGNPELVLNMAAATKNDGTVWFDEWHHGIRKTKREIVGPEQWLRYTPAGRSLLYVAGVIFLALLVQGRAFGKPIPLKQARTRRTPLEYITAIANLNRRAGHRTAVLGQYQQQIKRQLGRRYRVNSTLPNEVYVAELVKAQPKIDAEALLTLLNRLQRADVSEREMVQLAREASEWIKDT